VTPGIDGLAMVCTLHAEGPSTLRLLRTAGIFSLAEFVARTPGQVCAILGGSEAGAESLLRQAAAFQRPTQARTGTGSPTGAMDSSSDQTTL